MNLNKILKNQQDYYYSKDMKVKLVSYSQPSKEFQEMGIGDAQDLIAFCARVSNPSNQLNAETSEKLIRYLINHSHWSPLEMVTACLEIETTRDIARQILRHRSFSFQEFSQRYADPTKDLDFVIRETRLQDKKNRQNSIKSENKDLNIEWEKRQKQVIDSAIENYKWAVENGIAKEQARAVLPEGNTISRLYMNGTLRSWIHYIQLRASHGTQKEHTEIAKACAEVISKIFPMTNSL
jgi:thymidylate synthase (FAD)